jgi:hypothetical protein
MAIASSDCAPYLSLSLYKLIDDAEVQPTQLLSSIRKLVKEVAEKKGLENPKFLAVTDAEITADDTNIAWAHYVERRPPSWFLSDGVSDVRNQLIVVARRERLLALLFSDNGLRNAVAKHITAATTGPEGKVVRLATSEINKAFVESRVRTLWLSGAHRRTAIKPDSKILSGLELETALDPLGDQSYYFSSVRSTMSLSETLGSSVVGANPVNSRVWVGPTRSWDEFATQLNLLLDRAASRIGDGSISDKPLPILSSATTDISAVRDPYDIALIVPEEINDGAADGNGDQRWLQQFGDAARFELKAQNGSPNFSATVFWGDNELGEIRYEFEEASAGVRLKATKVDGFDEDGGGAEVLQLCRSPEYLTIYFDTGHTYSRGHFYETRFRDARFGDWRWVRMDLDDTIFKQEKPLDGKRFAVENTGNPDDKSLFGLVARHWPNLEDRGAQTGWLVCDDGAMESADFIHVDNTASPPTLTLIHVKGSGSDNVNRGLSVSDYEVVVGQAVKNLRHIDRELLKEKLQANTDGVLKDAVWHNGVRQQNRDGVLAMLDGLGSNLRKSVAVFQPRVQRSVYNKIRTKMDQHENSSQVRRMQQLDALLLGARADCFSIGADFYVISDGDDLPAN